MSDASKQDIQAKLGQFASAPQHEAAIGLLATLGYKSERRLPREPNTPDNVVALFATDRPFCPQQAL